MRRILLIAATLLLSLTSFAQEQLTQEEWEAIPPKVREKLNKIVENSQIARSTSQDWTFMIEDGTYQYAVPAGSIFNQQPRDRVVPEESNYLFSRWSDMTDIQSVYISPEMFGMVKSLPKFSIQDRTVDFTRCVRSLRGLYLLDFAQFRKGDPNITYSRNTTFGGLRKDIRDYLDKGHYITLTEMRKDGFYTRLYIAPGAAGTLNGFVLVHLDDAFDYGRVICLEGDIDRRQFEKILTNAIR